MEHICWAWILPRRRAGLNGWGVNPFLHVHIYMRSTAVPNGLIRWLGVRPAKLGQKWEEFLPQGKLSIAVQEQYWSTSGLLKHWVAAWPATIIASLCSFDCFIRAVILWNYKSIINCFDTGDECSTGLWCQEHPHTSRPLWMALNTSTYA